MGPGGQGEGVELDKEDHWVGGGRVPCRALCFLGGLVFSQEQVQLEMHHGGWKVDDTTMFRLQPIESPRGLVTFLPEALIGTWHRNGLQKWAVKRKSR